MCEASPSHLVSTENTHTHAFTHSCIHMHTTCSDTHTHTHTHTHTNTYTHSETNPHPPGEVGLSVQTQTFVQCVSVQLAAPGPLWEWRERGGGREQKGKKTPSGWHCISQQITPLICPFKRRTRRLGGEWRESKLFLNHENAGKTATATQNCSICSAQ